MDRLVLFKGKRRRLRGLAGALWFGAAFAPAVHAVDVTCTDEHYVNPQGETEALYEEAFEQCEAEARKFEEEHHGSARIVEPCHGKDLKPSIPWWSGRIGFGYQLSDGPDGWSETILTKSYLWVCKPEQGTTDPVAEEAERSLGEPEAGNAIGDPIDTATGNVYRHETDLTLGRWLRWERTYNSLDAAAGHGPLGPHWTVAYQRHLRVVQLPGTLPLAHVTRDDGRVWVFRQRADGRWEAPQGVQATLTSSFDAQNGTKIMILAFANEGRAERYDANGRLVGLDQPDGSALTFGYDGERLSRIADPVGRALALQYDAAGRLTRVASSDGRAADYAYDEHGQLAEVTWPGGERRQYRYDEAGHTEAPPSHRLTGVLAGDGTRLATYAYQADGRAVATELAAGSHGYRVQYHADGSSTTTDPSGTAVTRHYQTVAGMRRVSRLSGPCASCGTTAEVTYNAQGLPATLTDFKGRTTTLAYDAEGQEIERVEAVGTPEQRSIVSTWTAHKLTRREWRDAQGRAVTRTFWHYLSSSQPTARCEVDVAQAPDYTCPLTDFAPPAGVRRWSYAYCAGAFPALGCPAAGLPMSVSATGLGATRYAYYTDTDLSGCDVPGGTCHHAGDLRTLTNAKQQTTTFVRYDAAGRVTRQRDANGVLTDVSYHPRGWLLTRTVRANADGTPSEQDATTTLAYDDAGNVIAATDPDGVTLRYAYDAARRLTDVTDALGHRLHVTLDPTGQVLKQETFDASGTLRRAMARSYDALGRLTAVHDGAGRKVFDASFPDSYDVHGNLQRSANALGVQRRHAYDGLDRLVSTLDDYQGKDAATRDTASVFAYGVRDELLGVGDPDGLDTTYERDGFGQVTALHSPDTGTTRYRYDASGHVVQQTDARGITRQRTYDMLGRLTAVTYPDSASNASYRYDETNLFTGCASSAPIGRLTRVVEQDVTTAYCYDPQGRVAEKRQTLGGQTDVTRYTYTRAGRLHTETRPTGTVVTYGYNDAGEVASLAATLPDGASQPVASDLHYAADGQLERYTLANGQTVTRSIDANGDVTAIDSAALSLRFTRDAAGQITAIEQGGAQGQYRYDALGKLTQALDAQGQTQHAFTYSKTGDRLSKQGQGLAVGDYRYQEGTHWLTATGNAARTVDPSGNTTARSVGGDTLGFTYDDRGRLIAAKRGDTPIATYLYHATGERLAKRLANGTEQRFFYNEASQLIAERGEDARDYVWLGSLPVAVIDTHQGSSTLLAIHADHLGTPRVITDGEGKAVWSWSLDDDPFGENVPVSSSGYVFPLRFAGQYYDQETGLHYNLQRYYDPTVGRYVTSDPLGLSAGINTFAYVRSSPFFNVDPLGLACIPGWAASMGGATVGGAVLGGLTGAAAGRTPQTAAIGALVGAGTSLVATGFTQLFGNGQNGESAAAAGSQTLSTLVESSGNAHAALGAGLVTAIGVRAGFIGPGLKLSGRTAGYVSLGVIGNTSLGAGRYVAGPVFGLAAGMSDYATEQALLNVGKDCECK